MNKILSVFCISVFAILQVPQVQAYESGKSAVHAFHESATYSAGHGEARTFTTTFASTSSATASVATDSLPAVFNDRLDLYDRRLRNEAVSRFALLQLPANKSEWEIQRAHIRESILKGAGIEIIDQTLPFNVQETGTIDMEGYRIKNIAFQTLPNVYATANLFVPNGEGPFPAVIMMMGHWNEGKLQGQAVGHALALDGYVVLVMDPWGAGERASRAGEFEYHGSNLGASLMNVGRSLLGIQVMDNMRAVDYLVSQSYVDAENIGATGASGGGNQTMWLTAIDERIKAAVPVVSVGTFDSYVLGHNCICEVLVDGLTHTEASGILALTAPRALKLHNHEQESNSAFIPAEMLRSYHNAKPVYEMFGAGDNLGYDLFDLTHGYYQENRESMLGWFDLHLKGIGSGELKEEKTFENLSGERLLVYPENRFEGVETTAGYNIRRGKELRELSLKSGNFDSELKKNELQDILRISGEPSLKLKKVHQYSAADWDRFVLQTTDGRFIPVLHTPGNSSNEYVIIANTTDKADTPPELLDEWKRQGTGIILADLSGTGEASLSEANSHDMGTSFHTSSRAELWLGRTLLGQWVKELDIVTDFVREELGAERVSFDGSKEAGLAALFLAALTDNKADHITARNAPVSYLFDNRENIDFFSMAIHLPGILQWGDISMAAGLSGADILFKNPVSMSGRPIEGEERQTYSLEFEKQRAGFNKPGHTVFTD